VQVGIPREVKNREYRVAITPADVQELVRHGHEVVAAAGAGAGSSLPDEDYLAAGAKILPGPEEVWQDAELVLKVKEPVADEFDRIQSGQTLFTLVERGGTWVLAARAAPPRPTQTPTPAPAVLRARISRGSGAARPTCDGFAP